MYPHIPRVVAPPPPDAPSSTTSSAPGFKVRIAVGFAAGALLIVMFLILYWWVKHPPPTETRTSRWQQRAYAMPPIPRKKKADEPLLSVEVLEKHFPRRPYGQAMAAVLKHEGFYNANSDSGSEANNGGKRGLFTSITS